MAIRYTREYDLILDDLSQALATVPDFYEAFDMDAEQWNELDRNERDICIRTLSDDLFYALGTEASFPVGSAVAEYDAGHGIIKIAATPQLVHVIPLRD